MEQRDCRSKFRSSGGCGARAWSPEQTEHGAGAYANPTAIKWTDFAAKASQPALFEAPEQDQPATGLPTAKPFFVPKGHPEPDSWGLAAPLVAQNPQNVMLAALGYDYATCTVCGSNAAQQRVLTRAGWVRIASFEQQNWRRGRNLGWEVR